MLYILEKCFVYLSEMSRIVCVGPYAVEVLVVYEFYSVWNCNQLCYIIEETEGSVWDVFQC